VNMKGLVFVVRYSQVRLYVFLDVSKRQIVPADYGKEGAVEMAVRLVFKAPYLRSQCVS